jgi:hypothetical protein
MNGDTGTYSENDSEKRRLLKRPGIYAIFRPTLVTTRTSR